MSRESLVEFGLVDRSFVSRSDMSCCHELPEEERIAVNRVMWPPETRQKYSGVFPSLSWETTASMRLLLYPNADFCHGHQTMVDVLHTFVYTLLISFVMSGIVYFSACYIWLWPGGTSGEC